MGSHDQQMYDGVTPVSEEKLALLKQFRQRFRNITRILDCVTCEKCRVWGKMYFLGMGTSIKLLLLPQSMLSDPSINPDSLISRQELVALFNLLNQLAKSVQFASRAIDKELNYKINEAVSKGAITSSYGVITLVLLYALFVAVRSIKHLLMRNKSIGPST